MDKQEVLRIIGEKKVVAVVRTDKPEEIAPTVDALMEGGVNVIELTMTIPGVLDHIPQVIKRLGDDIVLGVGSVLNGEVAQQVVDAGASFIVSPIMKKDIIETAQKNDVATSVGAFTPTEIQTAWELGSDVVKVFPSSHLGPSYMKAVRAPMPHLKLLPTGGVDLDNVQDWLKAGVFALGVGSALVDIKAVREERFEVLTQNAVAFVEKIETFKK